MSSGRVRQVHDLSAMIAEARGFFGACGARPYFTHGSRVLQIAKRHGLVEEGVLADRRQPVARRDANMALATLCMFHTVRADQLVEAKLTIPKSIQGSVAGQLAMFQRIVDVVHADEPPERLLQLLNGGKPAPLALLVCLADYAAIYDSHTRIESFTGPHHQLLRHYSDSETAQRAVLADARFGEKLLAPLAELFGYPELAGELMRHAYRVNHPELYREISNLYRSQAFRDWLSVSTDIINYARAEIEHALKSAGFDFKIEIRPVKNQGKLMRKICRIMHDTSHKGEPFDSLAMAEEVRSNLDDIGLGKIHDWVAMRVTIVGYHGRNKSIKGAFQQNEESEMYSYAKRIVDAAFHRTCTEYGITLGEFKYYEFLEKLNGYSAGHWTFPYLNNRPFLTSEIQLNLSRWDILSRHGGAAHYLYIGGDRTIVENLGRAYHNLLYDVLGNTRGSTGTLKANKPDPGESSYKT